MLCAGYLGGRRERGGHIVRAANRVIKVWTGADSGQVSNGLPHQVSDNSCRDSWCGGAVCSDRLRLGLVREVRVRACLERSIAAVSRHRSLFWLCRAWRIQCMMDLYRQIFDCNMHKFEVIDCAVRSCFQTFD